MDGIGGVGGGPVSLRALEALNRGQAKQLEGVDPQISGQLLDAQGDQFDWKLARGLEPNLDDVDKASLTQLEGRAEKLDAQLVGNVDDAQAALECAAAELSKEQIPTASKAELQAKKESLGSELEIQNELAQQQAVLAGAQQQRTQLDADVKKAEGIVKGQRPNLEKLVGAMEKDLNRLRENGGSASEIREANTRLDPFRAQLDTVRAAQGVIARAKTEGPTLDKTISNATARISSAEGKLEGLRSQTELLDKQIAYAGAREDLAGAKNQLGQLRTVETRLRSTETALQTRDKKAIGEAEAVTQAAEEALKGAKSVAEVGAVKGYQQILGIEKQIADGKLDPRSINMDRLKENKAVYGKLITQAGSEREGTAREVVRQLQNPQFIKTMERMEPDARTALTERMLKSIEGTKVGDSFLERNLVPTMEGKPPKDSNVFDSIFKGANASQKVALKTLECVGGYMARESNADTRLLKSAMCMAIGAGGDKVRPEQLKTLNEACAMWELGGKEGQKEALAHLKANGLTPLAKNLDTMAKSFKVASGAFAAVKVFNDPNMVNGLKAGKSAADLVKMATDLKGLKDIPGMEVTGKVAERVAPIIEGGLAAYELYRKGGTIDRGDVGGSVGQALIAGGSAISTIGLGLDLTGAGAVLGVPLNAFGGGVAALGSGVDLVFGDNETEKWLKERAPQFLK